MRISLSRKILIVYGLLLSFSLIQGVLLFSIVDQFRSYNKDIELVKEFKILVHELEKHKTESPDNLNKGDNIFENEYSKAKNILTKMITLNHKLINEYATQLEDTETYLNNYRQAYFELNELVQTTHVLHAQGIQIFSGLRNKFADMEPELAEKLFFLLLDHYTIIEDSFHSQDITLLPNLKKFQREIALLTSDQSVQTIVQEAITITENNYLNSLAILDRQDFLTDSAAHLTGFCDSVVASLTKNINQYQVQLTWIMAILVAAAILITAVLFMITRGYFKKFLQNQQTAITAIENGKYEYPLHDLPRDELGDLASFMKGMATSLQKRGEEIRRSEENVRLLLNSAAEAIYGLDCDGKCTFCNNSFLHLMGYDREEELIGKNAHDLIHHTKVDGSEYPFEECVAHRGFLEGRQTHSENEMFWRRDGSSFYAECWSHPILQDDEVTGAVVTFLDITKRREALQKLHDSEELYRSLIENIDLGITLVDKNHTIIMTNPAQGRLFNRDTLSFKGQKCFKEFEKNDQICSHCPGVTAMETGKVHETFARGVKDDGSSFTVRIKAFPIVKEEGEVFGFIEVVEDVTEKLQAEQDLAAEKERLSVTLRSIGDGVITTDVDGRIVLINKVAEKLCGWSQAEALGKPLTEIFQIINEVTGEPCENPVEKVLATGQIVALANHTALIARDGKHRSIADSGAAIRDRDSEIIGVVLVFRDVTEDNMREKELLKGKKLESIGVLAGGIAHDFNNILSAILGNINLVRHVISPAERKAHIFLEEAEKASVRAQNLTHQLLTFSKGGEPIKQTASIISTIKDSTAFALRGTDIRYEYDIPADLWPVDVDRGQISQVIQNIVINARQAMPNGGTVKISCNNINPEQEKPIVLQKNRKFIQVNIADSGSGMPAELLDNIFDPYFTTKKEGNGLGLSICHSIIDKHQGYISVQSKQGTGTTFTFYLPASGTDITEEEPVHHEMVYAKKNLTILIMDDDEQIRAIADAMLAHLGCITLQARDGEEAIQLYKSSLEKGEPINAIIMDLTIPGGMGGKEAISEILKLDPRARVIVSSGYSNDPIMASHKEYGFCAAIVKPYQLKELARAIDEAVAG